MVLDDLLSEAALSALWEFALRAPAFRTVRARYTVVRWQYEPQIGRGTESDIVLLGCARYSVRFHLEGVSG